MKKLAHFIMILSILPLAGCSVQLSECEYEVISSAKSPDGKLTAYIVDAGCGATTGFVSWVAVSETEIKLNPKTHRTAVLDGKADKIYWIDDDVLAVSGNFTVFKKENDRFRIEIKATQ